MEKMAKLGDFHKVKEKLRRCDKKRVVLLHKLLFKVEGDKNNMKRIRVFNGFDYGTKRENFVEIQKYVSENFTTADLHSICKLLCISISTNIVENLLKNLDQLTVLCDVTEDDDEDESNSESEDD